MSRTAVMFEQDFAGVFTRAGLTRHEQEKPSPVGAHKHSVSFSDSEWASLKKLQGLMGLSDESMGSTIVTLAREALAARSQPGSLQ